VAKTHDTEKRLLGDIAPQVEHDLPGVEVLAVELTSPDRFVVYVDRPEGVDHALCVSVTDVLRDYLREYTIDVSSPGVERPLRTPTHFARVVGRHVAVRTASPIDGRSKFKGAVRDAGSDALTLAVDDTHVDIPYDLIVRSNLIDER
jgi:ribosome maturation factor RimP